MQKSEEFEMIARVHQGSVFHHLVSAVVIDEVTKYVKVMQKNFHTLKIWGFLDTYGK